MATDPRTRLGYLLKHASQRLAEISAVEFEGVGVTGRECAVLMTLDGDRPVSQQSAADALGIDRTTMVDLLDDLERRSLVSRRPDPVDRRRNAVELTPSGRSALRRGLDATRRAESEFLRDVTDAEAFRSALASAARRIGS